MSGRVDFALRRAFRTALASEAPLFLRDGLVGPDQQSDAVEELQCANHALKQRAQPLNLPGRPRAGRVVHLTFMLHTPVRLMIATGRSGVTFRPNSTLVQIEVTPESLEANGVVHLFTDRNPWSPDARFLLDSRVVSVDLRFLHSRNFRVGRNDEFGAGIVAIHSVPPQAFNTLICADDVTAAVVRGHVASAGLSIPVITDRACFFWPDEQRP